MERSVPQDPKQGSRCSSVYFHLIEGRDVPSTFSVCSVTRSTLTSVQFSTRKLRLVIGFKRVPQFCHSRRSLLNKASTVRPGEGHHNKNADYSRSQCAHS